MKIKFKIENLKSKLKIKIIKFKVNDRNEIEKWKWN